MHQHTTRLRIATRASQLAVRQAEMVRDALQVAHPGLEVELLPMSTAGDRDYTKSPAQWGVKGMFTKEIEDALLEGHADIAVHSMKDMPSLLPEGLMVAAMLPRANRYDAFVSVRYARFADVPQGAVMGCSSVRRTALLKRLRPDLCIVPFRGNVNTRLAKLEAGEVDATVLACAGLERLELGHHIRHSFAPEQMLPAVAQGAIGIECRMDDASTRELLAAINHADTFDDVSCERFMLAALDGSCQTPVCAQATLAQDILTLKGMIIHPESCMVWQAEASGNRADGKAIGGQVAQSLIEQSEWETWRT